MSESEQETRQRSESEHFLGPNLNFACTEAYNLLRTNLNMCAVAENGCPIIGVTSPLQGEGKSTTAVNLAYSMVADGKTVLLVELDMRLPVLATRLGGTLTPGMSDFLAKQADGTAILQKTSLHPQLYLISAGTIPPNPSELLGSAAFERVMQAFSKNFDCIILDLPPVNVVADALVVSKVTTGLVLVIRRGLCRKRDLQEALRRLNMVDAKIFGIVETGAKTHKKGYHKYGKKYGYGYGEGGKNGKEDSPSGKKERGKSGS